MARIDCRSQVMYTLEIFTYYATTFKMIDCTLNLILNNMLLLFRTFFMNNEIIKEIMKDQFCKLHFHQSL